MSLPQASVDPAATQSIGPDAKTGQEEQSKRGARSNRVMLLAARALWLAVMALAIIFSVASITVRYNQLLNFQSPLLFDSTTGMGDLEPEVVRQGLEQLGLSSQLYAIYDVALESVMVLGFLIVGVIIFSRKADDWMAIAVSLTLIMFGPALTAASYALVAVQPEWRPAYGIVNLGWLACGLVFFALFPDGKLVPGWMRFWCIAWFLLTVCFYVIPADSPYYPEKWPSGLIVLLMGSLLAAGVYAQIYRYRKVSGPARRHQTKWVVFGMGVFFISVIGGFLVNAFQQGSREAASTRLFIDLVALPLYYALLVCLPLTVGLAVLRYRLYDIDIIINRALVYVPLTAILAGLYSASIALLQKLFVSITGEKSDAAIVVTTLLLTTTFTPIKNFLQSRVDKRFKESPDATRKLRALDEQVKSVEEVIDPTQLSVRLLDDAIQAFGATSGAVQLVQGGAMQVVYASDNWTGDAKLSVPLESDGEQIGLLQLGARSDSREYSSEDQELLQGVVDRIARMVRLAGRR